MATLYYMIIEGRQAGPFPAEALKAQGLMPDTYVWREGLQNWVAASNCLNLTIFSCESSYGKSLAILSSLPVRTMTVSREPCHRIPIGMTVVTESLCRIPTGFHGPWWQLSLRSCSVVSE